ncbi:MAG: FG-GAP repeat-containing protein [Puniceicoccaceae bacterium 5H]|nr:MAG: FG-GAP repeat-containing protein [Puniceicoccaceae bacterium 5H]
MKKHHLAVAMLPLTLSPVTWGASTALSPTSIASINVGGEDGNPAISTGGVGNTIYIRSRDFASGPVRHNVAYLRFHVDDLSDAEIYTASLRLNRVGGDFAVEGRVAIYGLLDLPSNLVQDWTTDTFAYGAEFDPSMYSDGASVPGATPITLSQVEDLSDLETVTEYTTITLTDDAFVDFLQSRADDDGNVTLIVTMPSQGGNDKYYELASDTYDDASLRPVLEIAYGPAGLPAPPVGLAVDNISYAAEPTLTVDWDAIPEAQSYKVYRRAEGEQDATLVSQSNAASYFDDDVQLFGVYYYSVAAVASEGESVPSVELRVEVRDSMAGDPAAPNNLAVVDSTPGTIQIGWDAPAGAFLYDVYRSTHPDRDFEQVDTVATPAYTDSDVVGYRSYYYRVSTTGAGGVSGPSETVAVAPRFVEGGTVPEAPGNLSLIDNTLYTTEIGWDAVDDAQAYYVYRSTHTDGDFHLVGISDTTSLNDTFAVMPQNAYYYTVYAVGEGGFSEPSDIFGVDATLHVHRQMENLTRAPVAVPNEEGILVSWRLLGTDPRDTGFYIYRDGHRLNNFPLTGATNYVDTEGTVDSTYEIRATLDGFELPSGETARMLENGYLSVPLDIPEGGTTPDGVDFTYTANDASAADLDGDGAYEVVLKWDPTNTGNNMPGYYTGNVIIDAYEMDGTRLWRIDLGRNVRAGSPYTQFMVYDFDGNGKAEMICKTADATVDGLGNVIGDPDADWRSSEGMVLEGPEFLTVFNGETGEAMDTVDYVPQRGDISEWGDSYGGRVDRLNAAVA